MHSSARRILACLAILMMFMVSTARAADIQSWQPDNAVSPRGLTTYLDLARHFVPDLANSDGSYTGTKHIEIRHIAGPDSLNTEGKAFGVYDIASIKTQLRSRDRLLVLFDFAQAIQTEQGLAVLALYDVTHEPILLDAVDVGFDQSTSFFDQGLLPIAPDSSAVLTMSSHFNAGQSFSTQTSIMIRGDRFELIDSLTLLDDQSCGAERRQTIAYAANPDAAKPFAPITATVNDTITAVAELCADLDPSRLGTRTIRQIYIWNAGQNRYVPNSDAFERLKKENQARF